MNSQTYTLVRKLARLPERLFRQYLRDLYGPLSARMPGLSYCAQHHFSSEQHAGLWPSLAGVKRIEAGFDGALEFGFSGPAEQANFDAASALLAGEDHCLFELTSRYRLPRGSRTFVDRQSDGMPNGPDPLYRLHLYLNGRSQLTFRAWIGDWAAELAQMDAVQKLRLHLPQRYDNLCPAILEIAFESALAAAVFYRSADFLATAPWQSAHIDAMTVFRVDAVYTYLQGGQLTLAGLHGSSSAALIEEIGAAQRVSEQMRQLFHRRC